MVNIISGVSHTMRAPQLLSMFADRRRVFIERLRWNLNVVDGECEVDRFDDAAAIYLVESGALDKHMGSLRLLRTDRPNILGEIFPHLCDGPLPVGTDIFEITRLCLSPSQPATLRLLVRNRLISAMVDLAVARDIRAFTGVVNAAFLAQIMAMGWKCRGLGSLQRIGGAMCGAFVIEIEPGTIAGLGARGIYIPDTIASETDLEMAFGSETNSDEEFV